MMESRNFLRGQIFLVYLLLIWIFLSSAFLLTEVYHNFQMLSRSARQLMWQAGLRARWNLWSGPCIQIHPFTAHLLLLPFWGTGKCSKLFFIPGSINLKKKSMNWEAKLSILYILFSRGAYINHQNRSSYRQIINWIQCFHCVHFNWMTMENISDIFSGNHAFSKYSLSFWLLHDQGLVQWVDFWVEGNGWSHHQHETETFWCLTC